MDAAPAATLLAPTIGGGQENRVLADYATVPGGKDNRAAGDYSFAAGHGARAEHPGSFVWADAAGGVFGSSGPNQFLVRAGGGVGIGITNPAVQLHVNGDVRARRFYFSGNAWLEMDGSGTNLLLVVNQVTNRVLLAPF